ncbi:thioredoxin family protein [Alishewanella sp. SMS8]|uniref:thioredoxin family protein n=1 Tax=Alishewanella sp. SMS8 TaxID=2994676 RepID=UPI0027408882|nr:thioredoxin family protein [Alishewanella sp. SMS8]MDP5458200.1 thioredoxin family protein [Alishewanella sp. SMS8]
MNAFTSLALIIFSLVLLPVQAASKHDSGLTYQPEQQILPTLPALEQKAVAENKLLLVALGASWCHDSVALLEHFAEPTFAAALAERFELVLVDVAYLEFGQATTMRYQLPLYYGTPTVMIINPSNRQLLNKFDLMQWTNAASFDAAVYQQYFLQTDFKQQFAQSQQASINTAAQQQILDFEQQQATILAQGYQHLSPLLLAYETDPQAERATFIAVWNEVKTFRSQIIADVQALQQAAMLDASSPLKIPSYNEFSFLKPADADKE